MHRRVAGLQEVSLCDNPWGKAARAKGAKALGLRFQRTVEKALPAALHGQWLRFKDNNGLGFAQPDIIFASASALHIVECKLTDTSEADSQIKELYLPLLAALWAGPIHQIVVVKYLSPLTQRSRVVGSWDEALAHPTPILHAFSKRELAPPAEVYGKPLFSNSCVEVSFAAGYPQFLRLRKESSEDQHSSDNLHL